MIPYRPKIPDFPVSQPQNLSFSERPILHFAYSDHVLSHNDSYPVIHRFLPNPTSKLISRPTAQRANCNMSYPTETDRLKPMAYVVTEPCINCKYTDCVVVCPCECFHEGEQMLYIDPDECIDCGACAPECPVDAIFYEEDVTEEQSDFIALNAEMSQTTPGIYAKKTPLAN